MSPQQLIVVVALTVVSACASAPKRRSIQYVPAQRAVETPPPALPPSVTFAEQTLVPGAYTPVDQMRRLPHDGSAPTVNAKPIDLVANANRTAAQGPDAAVFFNAIQEYAYSPGMLYQIYSAPLHTTDIALQPGERHVGQVAMGDPVRWALGWTKSAERGVEQEHVVLKPTVPGLHTNLTIHTNRRSYLLEIHSFKNDTYMAAVKWRYPQDEVAKLVSETNEQFEQSKASAPITNPTDLNFHYALEILEGDPRWLPTQVFDDGRKTYIRFPPNLSAREVPVLFVARNNEVQLVNYYPRGDFYVADRVFNVAELRVGQQQQEVVRIERLSR